MAEALAVIEHCGASVPASGRQVWSWPVVNSERITIRLSTVMMVTSLNCASSPEAGARVTRR